MESSIYDSPILFSVPLCWNARVVDARHAGNVDVCGGVGFSCYNYCLDMSTEGFSAVMEEVEVAFSKLKNS